MKLIVAMECGFAQALSLLKRNNYISPTHTLQMSSVEIDGEEKDYFYEGCIQAVANFKNFQSGNY